MKTLNLASYFGSHAVSRADLENVDTPAATETWRPIPHSSIINMLVKKLPEYGLHIIQEGHGLYKEGNRHFGMFQVGGDGANLSDDFGLVFGIRNSHDKAFRAGLCLGAGVFVCSNLSFSAEVVIGRRHTQHILRDLPFLVNRAVGLLMQTRVEQAKRFEAYKNTQISDMRAHDLIIKALQANAINTTRVPKVVEQWHNPAHTEFSNKNVWRLFNGFTEVYKQTSLTELPTRSTKLSGVLDVACGLIAA